MTFSLCSLLPQGFSLSGFVYAANEQSAEAQDKLVSIDRKYLTAGQKLTVSNPGGLTLEYFVDNQSIGSSAPVLKDEYLEKWLSVKAYSGEKLAAEDSVYFSKLPVVYISTEDGKEISSKTEYKKAVMDIQNNTSVTEPMYSGDISIKGRGNSTWLYPKKPYKIKLDKKADLFSMGKSKSWVLLANYMDECGLRNDTAFALAKQAGVLSMDSVFVDVVINSEYAGCYQLCEQIMLDKNRVDIFDWEEQAEDLASAVCKKLPGLKEQKSELEDALVQNLEWVTSGEFTFDGKTYTVSDYIDPPSDITGGYLFELSYEYDELSKFTTPLGLKVMLKSPEYLFTNPIMMFAATKLWLELEAAYTSDNGYVTTAAGSSKHYTELADLDSMVSYWLVMEIMGNDDAKARSRYAYKQQGELLKFGPVWDFDHYSGSSFSKPEDTTRWVFTTLEDCDNFFKELLDDPLFVCTASDKYWQLRPYLENLVKDGGIIDSRSAYIREAAIADSERWNRAEGLSANTRGYEKDLDLFKKYLTERIAWLDTQFASDAVLIESTKTPYSASPYTKADDKLSISVKDSQSDTYPDHASAEHIISPATDAQIKIAVTDSNTQSLDIYINGLFSESVFVNNSKAEFTAERSKLSDKIGRKNVISVIGKDESGSTTYRNFTTLAVKYDTCTTAHKWHQPIYSWCSDNSECTALLCCEYCMQTKTETKKSAYSVNKQAECTENGIGTYTAVFTHKALGQSTVSVDIPATGHKWGKAEFTYSNNSMQCTASRVCLNDSTHTDTQTASARYSVTKAASCTQDGVGTYTFTFEDPSVQPQSRSETIPAKGHNWSDWKTAKAATTQAEGTMQRECYSCGAKQTKAIPKLEHTVSTVRLAGSNRYATAAQISRNSFAKSATVVLAYGLNSADALAGVPLAKAFNAPVLLTAKDSLPAETLAEIKRLGAAKVMILGGTGAISEKVEKALKDQKLTTERIAGQTRFATACAIAKKLTSAPSEIFFVYAFNYADALSASAAAAVKGVPIIYLKTNGELDKDTASYLASVKGKVRNAYVIGGEGVISNDMLKKAGAALGITPVRVAGKNRYATSIAVNEKFKSVLTGSAVCVAKGLDFPDALAGGVFAALKSAPLLLADTNLKDEQAKYLQSKKADTIYIFGGTAAVPASLADSVRKASL